MISYWEQTALVEYDLVVIGAGITGIFCALTYRKKYPNARIAILERGLFSEGASTKNAGFACFGSLSELLEDRQLMGDEALLELVQQRREGLALLKNTLNEKAIGLELNGGYELFFEENPLELEKLESINKLLKPLFNKKVFRPNNSKINSFGFDSEKVKHLIENPFEGGLHTGKLIRNLRLKANSLKIEIFSHSWVEEIDTSNTQTQIQLKNQSIKI
ncbi:MAG: FAD-dependent oxidoreductase, partial [Flavobacteriaceae bacterium]